MSIDRENVTKRIDVIDIQPVKKFRRYNCVFLREDCQTATCDRASFFREYFFFFPPPERHCTL